MLAIVKVDNDLIETYTLSLIDGKYIGDSKRKLLSEGLLTTSVEGPLNTKDRQYLLTFLLEELRRIFR